jgi:hypothetical protein
MNPEKLLRKSYVTFIIIIFWGLWSFPQICTGQDIFRPSSHTDLALKTTNPGNAYDPVSGSAADIETNVDAFPSIIFDTFSPPTTSVYSSLRLYVKRSSTVHTDDKWGIKYSTNGGSSWRSLDSMSSQTISAPSDIWVELDTSQDLNQLQVRIDTDKKKKADNGYVHIYDIRVEGEIATTPYLNQSAYRFFEVNGYSGEFYEKVSNSRGTDEAKAMAIDSTSMYVVGFALGKWRIERRWLNNGSLVAGFGPDDDGVVIGEDTWGEANAIAIDDTYMYVAGDDYTGYDYRWRIEKRLLSNGSLVTDFDGDGVVISDPSGDNDAAYGIAIHGDFIYVVGSDRSPGASDAQWRIEKRDCDYGSLEEVIVVNFSVDDDIPYAIAVDPPSVVPPSMYVVGYDRIPGSSSRRGRSNRGSSNAEWRIEKRSLLAISDLQGSEISNPTNDFDIARGIAIDSPYMYVIGFDQLGFFDTEWRIEQRLLEDLTLTPGLGGDFGDNNDGIITADYGYDDQPTAIAIYGTHMYLAGFSTHIGSGGDTAWRIEKRNLGDGELVKTVVNDIDSEDNDKAFAIAVDSASVLPADASMYVAGYFTNSRFSDGFTDCFPDYPLDCFPDYLPDWRIVKRALGDLSLDLLEGLSISPFPSVLQNQSVDTLVNGNEFRLKMLLHVGTGPPPPPMSLPSNFYQFKLQYSYNNGGYEDITDRTPIAFKDNPIASDGTTIIGSGVLVDPKHTDGGVHLTEFQTFEKANNFTNSFDIEDGEDGMWDFSLYVNNAALGTYSFRIVIDNGTDEGLPLDDYIVPDPEVTVIPPPAP